MLIISFHPGLITLLLTISTPLLDISTFNDACIIGLDKHNMNKQA